MDQTGKEYYYNKELNISQWVHPTAADNQSTPTSTMFVSQQQRMDDRLPTPIIVSGPPRGKASINGKRLGLQEPTGVSTWPDPETDPFGLSQKDRGWNVRVWRYWEADTEEFPSFDWETNSFKDIGGLIVTHKTSTEIMYEDYEWTLIVGAPEYYFAAICSGNLRVREAGVYTFWTESDDGSEMYVDKQRIVENGGLHPPQKREGKVALSSDFHFILVKFFQCEGGATLKVTYSGPDTGGKVQPVRLDIASDPLWSSPSQLQDIIEGFPKAAQEPGPDGRLPLHWAAVSGSAKGVDTLLNAFPETATVEDNVGRLPLHVAAESNPNKEVIEVLLKKFPAAASMHDNDDNLPYQVAEKANNKAVSEMLLKAACWEPILIDAEMSGFIGTTDDKILQDAIRSSEAEHMYKSALLRDRPLMASLYLSNVLARFSRRQRSVDMEVASKSDDRAVAMEQLATFVVRDLISWCSLFRKFEDYLPGDEKGATVVLDSALEYSSSLWNGDDSFSGELDCDTNSKLAWHSEHNDHDQYFQMDAGRVAKIRGVVTRGCTNSNSWVTSYRIKVSNDLKTWKNVLTTVEQRKEVMKKAEGVWEKFNEMSYTMQNDEGADVCLGTGDKADGSAKFYCGRTLGVLAIPGSDGQCGPNNGPQCESCKRFGMGSEVKWQNDDGAEVRIIRPCFSLEDTFPHVYGGDIIGANNLGYNSGKEAKFCCGRVLPETNGPCGPQSQCKSCKQLQETVCDGNSDVDTPVPLSFEQHVEARYVRIIPQTWQNDISMRAGLLIDAPRYLEKEVDEALEFMVDNKLKAILSDAVCVRIVKEKWNGRPWKVFWERFDTISRSLYNFVISLQPLPRLTAATTWSNFLLVLIAGIIVILLYFVIFLPLLLGVLIISKTGALVNSNHHRGVKILATVLLLLSLLLFVPYVVVSPLIVGPIAFLSVPWPPFWRFLLHKTTYVGFCVIIWYLPRLEEEDIGAEAKNLGLEVAAAVLLVSFLWDESTQLIRTCIRSFSRGVTAADLQAKISHAELLVNKAKARQAKTVSDHKKKVSKICDTLDSKEGLSMDMKELIEELKDACKDIDTITDDVIKDVRKKAGKELDSIMLKELESEIKLLKEAKTKKTHDVAASEKELVKAEKAKNEFEKHNNTRKWLNDFLHSLTDVMLWYTNDIWNCLDFVSHLVALAAGVTRGCLYAGVPNLEPTAVAQLHMWAVLLLWARLVSILHVSSFLGPLLHIVEVMLTKDVPQFLILCVLMMVPFVGSLSHRFGNDCSVESKTCEIQDFNGFGSAGWSFLKMFADAGKGAPLDLVDGSWGPQEIFILWAAYILLLIALVNLLIAQFSKTFDTVFENSTKEYLLRRAELLMEWKDIPPYPPPFNVVASLWRAAAWLLSYLRRAAASLSHYFTGTDPFDQEWLYWTQEEKSSDKDKLHLQFKEDKSHCKCSKDHPLKMVKKIDLEKIEMGHFERGTRVMAEYTDGHYAEAKIVCKNDDDTYDIAWNDSNEEHTKGKTCDQLDVIGGPWYCDVCYNSYNSNEESRLRCDVHDECNYDLCKVCAKEIVEKTRKQRKVELKFNFKVLVPRNALAVWRESLLEDFQQTAEFGSEAQMEKFKGIMLKAKNTTQTKLKNLEKKIEGIENLLKEVVQKLNGHNSSFSPTVGDGR